MVRYLLAYISDLFMAQVNIYTTQTCGYCRSTKQFFQDNGIEYNEIDVGTDREKAREMIQKSGQMGVPVTSITHDDGSEELVIGFDTKRLKEVLGIE